MAAAAVVESRGLDSPSTFSESQADTDDIIFPCKGCGEILEEGKAFELAGNRWHIDCFRCNTCGTLLDSDANLLLLGDGSLICNNCTYSCNACGNKIEDLAILTGDQAFCSACFRCRNCKRKIENLRYARTSQGIFCMSCHESLMARRRKKSTKTPKPPQNGSGATKEKALPSLPPGAVPTSAFSPDMETPPSETYSGTPGARSPPERSYYPPQRTLSAKGASSKRDVSPMSEDARKDATTLPATTYGDRRPSNVDEDSDDGEERGFLPMAFDPNPVAPPPINRKAVPRPSESSPPASDGRPPPDYFTRAPKAAARDARKEEERARSVSTEREPERNTAPLNKQSPHIFYQEKGRSRKREVSGNNTPSSLSGAASPLAASAQEKTKTQQVEAGPVSVSQNDGFRLQEVPKSKKAASRSNSKAESPSLVSPVSPALDDGSSKNARPDIAMSNSPVSMTSQSSGINPFDDPKRREGGGSAPAPPRPVRGDSLAPHAHKTKQTSPTDPPTPSFKKKAHSVHGRGESTNSANFVDAKSTQSRDESSSKSVESPQPMRTSFDAPPPRSSSRPTGPGAQNKPMENFTAPRAPPPPPPAGTSGHRHNESISTLQSNEGKASDGQMSPGLRSAGLPKHSMDGAFSMDDEMARIMRGEAKATKQAGEGGTTSMMRKVSNAVKHGRSFSDRGLHSAGKSSANGAVEIGSPMNISSPLLASPTGKESYDDLMSQLRRARARITELEADYGALETKMNSSTEIKNATNELREKRDTITVLDTQREVVVRELEAMTEHLAKAKDSKKQLDIPALKSELLKDFSQSLQKLKEDMSAEIEDLMHKRNELTEEISKLIQMKDKGFQEYEALSNKNAQLQEMNSQILSNLQDTYKANRVPNGGANGLGIYHPGPPKSSESQNSTELRNLNLVSTDSSMPDLLRETEAEPATVLTAPQVVNIRKGQPKKFNWRKGGERMAKNVTKGIKGAFVSERREGESPYGNISVPYAQSQQAGPGSDQGSINGRQGIEGPKTAGAGFGGFFGGQKNAAGLKPGALGSMKNSSSTNLASTAVEPSVLFGSDLTARCEYERRLIPAIVSRCIEEVEARGMDMEGVYRKSGGSGQVKTIQLGFEKDGGYDISDEDLDIHAVTSTLKQYFRKLPDPLITYEAYDALLAAGQEKEKGAQLLALRQAVAELPEHHRDTLEFLLQHLARVVELENLNLMTPLNLAVVFAPTIMRPLSIEREMSDMQAQRVAVQALLENWRGVFEE